MREALRAALADALGREVEPSEPVLLPGGASKEAWAVDADGLRLIVRRAGGGVIHAQTLSLEQEYRVLVAARQAGVTVPKVYAYIADLDGREAFVMERVEGETIGRRVVRRPELEQARQRLPLQLAEELARVHTIPRATLPFLPVGDIEELAAEYESVEELHPAIELGLRWLREHAPSQSELVVNHGDFRIGNVIVGPDGLRGVLDWEFAHVAPAAEDLAWPLVRAWRFGVDAKRLGGVGDVEPYLERYVELTGREVSLEELAYWELAGNVAWAVGMLTQARRHLHGQERSVELAILGRLSAEVEYEIVHLLERAA